MKTYTESELKRLHYLQNVKQEQEQRVAESVRELNRCMGDLKQVNREMRRLARHKSKPWDVTYKALYEYCVNVLKLDLDDIKDELLTGPAKFVETRAYEEPLVGRWENKVYARDNYRLELQSGVLIGVTEK